MFKLLIFGLSVQLALAAPDFDIITPQLKSTLVYKSHANIFITLKDRPTLIIEAISRTAFADRGSRLNGLYDALTTHAYKSQEPILNFLKSENVSSLNFKSFWITNQIYVENADSELVSSLASSFSSIISSIDEEFLASIDLPINIRTNISRKQDDHEWGVIKIEAPQAWEHLGGLVNAGEGVVVATIDTGVRVTHEALRDNFFGEYGWFDPATRTKLPTDSNGHGTHTTGTIAGGKGIGVAPKAKWSACRGCASMFCSQNHLLACGQFVACPTLFDESNPDCTKAPHLVSNSWGGGRGATWFDDVISTWHAAGITPLFSNGNSGPNCNTANSPADRNVIGVGSTTVDDEISRFSSVGPSIDGKMKPEISAPGSNVISAYNTADDAYASLSGTSMACPHAAGVIALLKTRQRDIEYDVIKGFLVDSADQDVKSGGVVCEDVGDDVFPNHVFGNGRINALKSVMAQSLTSPFPTSTEGSGGGGSSEGEGISTTTSTSGSCRFMGGAYFYITIILVICHLG